MAKTPSSRESLSRQAAREPDLFSHDELVAAVCKYFCRGLPMTELRKEIEAKLGIPLGREKPYKLLSHAAKKGWIQFQAPLAYELAEQMMRSFPRLKDVRVVRTGVSDDISYQVADLLMDQICTLGRARGLNAEVHLGFAGGKALRKTARYFAEMLREPREDLPKRIVFHAMVAGFNVEDPSTDPNGFFTYFAGEPALQVQTRFVGLLAPGIVKPAEIPKLRSMRYIGEAFDRAREIDIVVTSAGGHWQKGHSGFCSMFGQASPRSLEQLNRAGCIGDMMWRPLGAKGPLEINTEMRTVTLMELSALPDFISRGGSVVLLVGPCGNCGGPKEDVLSAILTYQRKLITHLVVDSRSARGVTPPAPVPAAQAQRHRERPSAAAPHAGQGSRAGV